MKFSFLKFLFIIVFMLSFFHLPFALAAPPGLSPHAGSAAINEIQRENENSLKYVEIYFIEEIFANNWVLHTHGPGASATGGCPIPSTTYSEGQFLIIDDNCLNWHPNQREVYILDGNGLLIHFVSLWHTGNQNVQGVYGNPVNWPSEYFQHTTNLNHLPGLDNYCATIDGTTNEFEWNEGNQSCTPTEGYSNSGILPNTGLALLARGDVSLLGSSNVKGNVQTNQGNVTFGGGAKIFGDLTVRTGATYDPSKVVGDIIIDDIGKKFCTFTVPSTEPTCPSLSVTSNRTIELTNDTCYDKLEIKFNSTLTFDIGNNDIILVVNEFNKNDQTRIGSLKIFGSGNLIIFIKEAFDMFSSSKLNYEGNPEQLVIFYSGDRVISLGNNTRFFGALFSPNAQVRMTGSAEHRGYIEADSYYGGSNTELFFDFPVSHPAVQRFCNIPPGPVAPIAQYLFEDSPWTGTVSDTSGNDFHGAAEGGVTSNVQTPAYTSGYANTCRYGTFNGQDSGVDMGSVDLGLDNEMTAMAWVRWGVNPGDGNEWANIATSSIFTEGSGNTGQFWLQHSQYNSMFEFAVTTGSAGDSTRKFIQSNTAPQQGVWQHVTGVYDGSSLSIYINGIFEESTNHNGSIYPYSSDFAFTIGRWSRPQYRRFQGNIDEVRVFNYALSQQEISEYMTTTRPCGLDRCPPGYNVAYQDDFTEDLSNWSVSNNSGNFGNPKIVNGRLRLTDASSSVSTIASLQRFFPAAGNEILVEFDYYAYGRTSDRGADGIATVLSDATVWPEPGAFGGSLGYAQKDYALSDCTIPEGCPGFAGGWLGIGLDEWGNYSVESEGRKGGYGYDIRHAVAVRGSGSGMEGYRYLGGTQRTSGSVSLDPPLDVAGTTPGPGHRYRIVVDHKEPETGALVSVKRRTDPDANFNDLSPLFSAINTKNFSEQADVPENLLLTLTGSTGAANNIHEIGNLLVCAIEMEHHGDVDHYRIEHDGIAITCEPTTVTVKACGDNVCSDDNLYEGEVRLTLTPGGWVGNDQKTFSGGSAEFQFQKTENGVVTLGISDPRPAASSIRCFTPEGETCNLEFVDAALIITDSNGNSIDIETQIAGEVRDDLYLSAIRTDDNTGACNATIFNEHDVSWAFTCRDPDTCAGKFVQIKGKNDFENIAANNGTTPSEFNSIEMNFGNNSRAPFSMVYPDVGEISLHAEAEVELLDDEGTEITVILNLINGGPFVVKPHHFSLDRIYCDDETDNPAATDHTGDQFCRAGQDFHVEVSSRNANDEITRNYGQEVTPETVRLDHLLVAPSDGENGTLSGSFNEFGEDCDGNPEPGVACGTFDWSEVGIISLNPGVGDSDYLGAGDVNGTMVDYVGRFYADHFNSVVNGTVAHECNNFTYYDQDSVKIENFLFSAFGVNGTSPLNNYQGDFAKFDLTEHDNYNFDVNATLPDDVVMTKSTSPTGVWDHGTATATASFIFKLRPEGEREPISPFITIDPEDEDGAKLSVPTVIHHAMDADGKAIRYGRLRLLSAHGPETQDLEVPMHVQYFDGTSFVLNTQDECTFSNATDNPYFCMQIMESNSTEWDFKTSASVSDGTSSFLEMTNPPNSNTGGLLFSAPGIGNIGYFDIRIALDDCATPYTWLKHTDGTDPSARATFGVRRTNERIIFQREMF